jgi:IS605 OrfB family transposase
MIKVIHGEIYSEDFSQLNKLVEDFSSCVRFSYNRFKKDDLGLSDVGRRAKKKYLNLNSRQVADAALRGKGLFVRFKEKKIVFGSRKGWDEFKNGKISKQEWHDKRNNQIYSRGDVTKIGNPNTRIVGDKLRITVGFKEFIFYKLFIPDKFKNDLNSLLVSKQAYNVRLIRKDNNRFRVVIDYSISAPLNKIGFSKGTIGIDTNIDRIAICEVAKDGNFIKSFSLINNKLQFASVNKRNYEISLLVKRVIQFSKDKNKGIVFENLKFKKNFNKNHKLNRIKSNFVYRKFLELLERKCIENGIFYKKVNPAYTSIIGKLKYKDIYKINTHEASAFVIARRGLGCNEKLSFKGYNHKEVKDIVFRNLAGKYKNKRVHSWVLWKCLNDNAKAVLTGLSRDTSNLKELGDCQYDTLDYEGETPSGKVFQPELVVGSDEKYFLGQERGLSKIL